MDITVIIPLYNGARFIEQTLQSVLGQTKRTAEIIIVDDGSSDNSPEIAESFPGVKLIRNTHKHSLHGGAYARSLGLQQATSSFVTFLDQDDIWHPDHLQLLSHILDQNRDCPAAVANCRTFHKERDLLFEPPSLDVFLYDPWAVVPANRIATPSCVLLKRSSLNAVGGWPVNFTVSDFHLWLKIGVEQPLIYNRTSTVGYRLSVASNSQNLRREKARHLIDSFIGAIEDTLPQRLNIYPKDEARIRLIVHRLQEMGCVVQSAITQNAQLLVQSVIRLEHLLSGESPAIIRNTYGHLFWLLRPIWEQSQQQSTLIFLLENWPPQEQIPQTYSYALYHLLRNLSRRCTILHLSHSLGNVHRLFFLFGILASRNRILRESTTVLFQES